jgi:hypothetical protein
VVSFRVRIRNSLYEYDNAVVEEAAAVVEEDWQFGTDDAK